MPYHNFSLLRDRRDVSRVTEWAEVYVEAPNVRTARAILTEAISQGDAACLDSVSWQEDDVTHVSSEIIGRQRIATHYGEQTLPPPSRYTVIRNRDLPNPILADPAELAADPDYDNENV